MHLQKHKVIVKVCIFSKLYIYSNLTKILPSLSKIKSIEHILFPGLWKTITVGYFNTTWSNYF